MLKKIHIVLSIMLIATVFLTACGSQAPKAAEVPQPTQAISSPAPTPQSTQTQPAAAPAVSVEPSAVPAAKMVSIEDSAGKTVQVPQQINKIVITCYGGATHELVVLNGKEKIPANDQDVSRIRRFSPGRIIR